LQRPPPSPARQLPTDRRSLGNSRQQSAIVAAAAGGDNAAVQFLAALIADK